MAVAQPDILLLFDASSGKTITQYGTNASGYTIGAAPDENEEFSWHPNANHELSYLETETVSGAEMVVLSTAASLPGAALETINCALKFRIDNYHTALTICWFVSCGDRTFEIAIMDPTGGGNFDIRIRVGDNLSAGRIEMAGGVLAGKSFGVDYVLSFSINTSNPNAVQARCKLDGNAVIEPATQDWGGLPYGYDQWPTLFADPNSFTELGGVAGRMYWFAYQKGGSAWSAADLASINSDPDGTITGWPGGAGPAITGEVRGAVGPPAGRIDAHKAVSGVA